MYCCGCVCVKCTYTYPRTPTHSHIPTHTPTYPHTHTPTHTHTHPHTYTTMPNPHDHTYTYTHRLNRALELQLWNTLPAFCRWPTDVPTTLNTHMKDIGTAFNNRHDLRAPMYTALCTLCTQTRTALQVGGGCFVGACAHSIQYTFHTNIYTLSIQIYCVFLLCQLLYMSIALHVNSCQLFCKKA